MDSLLAGPRGRGNDCPVLRPVFRQLVVERCRGAVTMTSISSASDTAAARSSCRHSFIGARPLMRPFKTSHGPSVPPVIYAIWAGVTR